MRSNDNSIIRVCKNTNHYALIDKYFLDNDNRLSLRAKGLLAYLLAKPDDWRVYVGDLVHRTSDGRTAIYSTIKELINFGYIKRDLTRNEKGKIVGCGYTIYEMPRIVEEPEKPPCDGRLDTVFPDMASPFSGCTYTGGPHTVSMTQLNTISINNNNKEIQQQPISDLPPTVDRGDHEKGVVVVEDTPGKIISAPEPDSHGPAQDEIQELIDFAKDQEPQEIILDIQRAREIIQKTGSLDAAKEKIEAASAYIAKEYKAGREINTIMGIMKHVMKLDTGGIKLGRKKLDECQSRLAEKEEKYRDIYVT